MTIKAERDYLAIGMLASHLRCPVRSIEAAALALKMAPALRLNGVPHYDATQVEKLTNQLQESAK